MKTYKFIDGNELPIANVFCIGRNYGAHAKEMGATTTEKPMIFLKTNHSIIDENQEITIPNFSQNAHHEIEIVVVIGRSYDSDSMNSPLDCIAGIGIGIDITLRDIQAQAKKDGHPWATAKSFKGSAPLSKIIPASELDFSQNFTFQLKVNNEIRQAGNSNDMIFSIADLISYIDDVFGLGEGDCIYTGTPEGVAQMKSGDELELSLNGILISKFRVK